MHKLNWDDLRFVLAVADTGSVSSAARSLGVNHATVLRRIASFEESCGGPVFERDRSGYRLRPSRAPVIEAARLAAQHVHAAQTLMHGRKGSAGKTLRLTSTDTFCQTVLSWIFPALERRIRPDHLVYLCSNAHLDMARLRADIALRPAVALPDDLVGKPVAEMGFAVYRRAGATGAPTWLGLTGALDRSKPAQWMAGKIDPEDICASADSFSVLTQMAARGNAQAILPCILGDAASELVRVRDAAPDFTVPVWIACHRDLAGSDRLQGLMDGVEKLMQPHLPALRGQGRAARA